MLCRVALRTQMVTQRINSEGLAWLKSLFAIFILSSYTSFSLSFLSIIILHHVVDDVRCL